MDDMRKAPSTPERARWSSRNAFLLATVGGAVGLGNLWRFPYIAGENGGSGFVLVYVGFVLLIGLPVMTGEMLLGRMGGRNPLGSMRALVHTGALRPVWLLIGWLSLAVPFFGLSYYAVVAAWAIDYLGQAALGEFTGFTAQTSQAHFADRSGQALRQVVLHASFIALAGAVVARGVNDGIERACRVLMPALFALLVGFVIYNAFYADFSGAIRFLFTPDFSRLTGQSVLLALGQALFSLGIGAGLMITFGSYLPREVAIPSAAATICVADTLVALLAGLVIFPIVFASGLAPAQGPGLIFITLPVAFGQMGHGTLIGTLFFVLLLFAAFTTAIAMLEAVVAWLVERNGARRSHMTLVAVLAIWLAGVLSVLSFNTLAQVHPLDMFALLAGKTFFDLIDFVVANIMLPVNALLIALCMGWAISRDWAQRSLRTSSDRWLDRWRWMLRYPIPLALMVVMLDLWF